MKLKIFVHLRNHKSDCFSFSGIYCKFHIIISRAIGCFRLKIKYFLQTEVLFSRMKFTIQMKNHIQFSNSCSLSWFLFLLPIQTILTFDVLFLSSNSYSHSFFLIIFKSGLFFEFQSQVSETYIYIQNSYQLKFVFQINFVFQNLFLILESHSIFCFVSNYRTHIPIQYWDLKPNSTSKPFFRFIFTFLVQVNFHVPDAESDFKLFSRLTIRFSFLIHNFLIISFKIQSKKLSSFLSCAFTVTFQFLIQNNISILKHFCFNVLSRIQTFFLLFFRLPIIFQIEAELTIRVQSHLSKSYSNSISNLNFKLSLLFQFQYQVSETYTHPCFLTIQILFCRSAWFFRVFFHNSDSFLIFVATFSCIKVTSQFNLRFEIKYHYQNHFSDSYSCSQFSFMFSFHIQNPFSLAFRTWARHFFLPFNVISMINNNFHFQHSDSLLSCNVALGFHLPILINNLVWKSIFIFKINPNFLTRFQVFFRLQFTFQVQLLITAFYSVWNFLFGFFIYISV